MLKERYRLLELIAEGGTSHVYRAEDLLASAVRRRSVELVVKVHHIVRAGDRDVAPQMALEELTTARRLSHDNIVRIYDFDWDPPVCFITMEYVPGETLAQRLARSPARRLPVDEALRIALAAARALDAAHQLGLVHADLKPGNILLGEDGAVKLIDFATAHSLRDDVPGGHDYLGYSPRYASPQLLQERTPAPADDVYALACVVYEMLAGAPPYGELDSLQALEQGLAPRRPAGVGRAQWRLLRRALAPQADRRPASPGRLVAGLRRAGCDTRRRLGQFALLAAVLGGGGWGSLALIQHTDEHLRLTAAQQALEGGRSLAAALAAAPPAQRPQLLEPLLELPPTARSVALAVARPAVTEPLLEHVRGALRRASDAASLDTLQTPVERALRIYPDSAGLHAAAEMLADERRQLTNSLTLRFQQLWRYTAFTAAEGKELAVLLDELAYLGVAAGALSDPATVERYAARLQTAIAQRKPLALTALAAFRASLPQLAELDAALAGVEPADLQAARRLAAYHDGGGPFPVDAADRIWGGHLKRLNAEIPKLWRNQDLTAMKQQLEALVADGLVGDYPPLTRARRALIERMHAKAEHYRRYGNNKRVAWLQGLAAEVDKPAKPRPD